jgi:hypothetical protein
MYARITGILLAIALAFTGLATAQERFGALTGKVTDQQSSVVPGVTVTTTNTQSGESRGSSRGGRHVPGPDLFRAVNRPVRASGFTTASVPDVLVLLGREFEINTQLAVGAQTETVQVVGEASRWSTPAARHRHNVSAEEFDRLPKGRSFQSIAFSAPSVSQGEIEGGIQVNAPAARELVHRGRHRHELARQRASRQNTVFDTCRSAGQDQRHLADTAARSAASSARSSRAAATPSAAKRTTTSTQRAERRR